MTDELQYPIGKFVAPTEWEAGATGRWRFDLSEFPARLRAAVAGLDDRQLDTPYRDEGWTVRQTVHHLADSHINAYCRFRLALTEDAPTIKPYDEALWAELPDARTAPVAPSLAVLDGLHQRWIALYDSLGPDQWARTFVHPEHRRPLTLWHTAALYAWHCKHHVAHIVNLRTRKNW